MREAYRKNKNTLYDHLFAQNIKLAFVVILRGNAIPDYLTIEKSIKEVIWQTYSSYKPEDRGPKSEAGRII